tara:strand:- start:1222 stop:1434 length:213 start_codon:yes stop_codon:yes gene_type:complete
MYDKIEEALVQIKQERLLNMIQSDNVRRANDDLSRSLIKIPWGVLEAPPVAHAAPRNQYRRRLVVHYKSK